ncbi:MAG: hypothetical protein Fur0021_34300 [Candidatus Promineifilaceae bacterium]
MRISHRYKFVFLALPRTGSTTVRKILDAYSDVKSVHVTQTTAEFPFYHHISARELKRIFDDRGWDWFAYRRFCVVRNPFDRIVSLYHHYQKTNADRDKAKTSLYNFLKYLYFQVRPEMTFAEYVARLDPKGKLTTTLMEFIGGDDGALLVDDVLTFENLATELPAYLQRMNISINPQEIPVLNASASRQPYAVYYTNAARERVASLYAYEIERFSYTFAAVPAGGSDAAG